MPASVLSRHMVLFFSLLPEEAKSALAVTLQMGLLETC